MATYDWETIYFFDETGNYLIDSGASDEISRGPAMALDDGEADMQFSPGETISLEFVFYDPDDDEMIDTSAIYNITFQFEGTIEYGGMTLPVFNRLDPVPDDYPGNLIDSTTAYIIVDPRTPIESGIDVENAPNIDTAFTIDGGDITQQNFTVCFLGGTLIDTPAGPRAVEELRIGDPILTAEGRIVPVKWVGRQTTLTRFGPAAGRAPIRVAAGALGPNMPRRDLRLTADHALLVDGLLINAGALVNGTTIAPIPLARMPARFTYWHVETEAHSVLLAENCPSESFIDYTPRAGFDNYAEYVAQGGDDAVITELPMPRISTPRLLLPALRQRLGIGRAA